MSKILFVVVRACWAVIVCCVVQGAVASQVSAATFSPAGTGNWTYQVCSTAGAPCAVPSSVLAPGWVATSSAYFSATSTSGGSGAYIGNRAVAVPANASQGVRWYAPTGNSIASVYGASHVVNPSGKFSCRLELGDGGGNVTASTPWIAINGSSFGGSLSGTGAFVGFAERATLAAPALAVGSNRCAMQGSTDQLTVQLADLGAPVTTDPAALSAQSVGNQLKTVAIGQQVTNWYGPIGDYSLLMQAQDTGSGIESFAVTTNAGIGAGGGSSPVNVAPRSSVCAAGMYGDQRPCLTYMTSNSGAFNLAGNNGLVQGTNSIQVTSWDFSGQSSSSSAQFGYDSVAPTISISGTEVPSIVGPSIVVPTGGTLHVKAALSDATSGIRDYQVASTNPSGVITVCAGTNSTVIAGSIDCPWNIASPDQSGTYQLGSLSAGLHTLSIIATDNSGNRWVSTESFVADFDLPTPPSQVSDMSTTGNDVDVTSEAHALAMSWLPSSDAQTTISGYISCFSTSNTSCQPVSGTATTFVTTTAASATAQGLTPGVTYFSCVQALDAAGNSSQLACSDGFTLPADTTPPGVLNTASIFDLTAAHEQDRDVTARQVDFAASWLPAVDSETNIAAYEACISSSPTSCVAVSGAVISHTSTQTAVMHSDQLATGSTVYSCVRAQNGAGLYSDWGCSDGFIVNTAAPAAPLSVNDGLGSSTDVDTTDQLGKWSMNWTPSSSQTVVDYSVCVSAYANGQDCFTSAPAPWLDPPGTAYTFPNLTLPKGLPYWSCVRSINDAGIASMPVCSDSAVVIDVDVEFPIYPASYSDVHCSTPTDGGSLVWQVAVGHLTLRSHFDTVPPTVDATISLSHVAGRDRPLPCGTQFGICPQVTIGSTVFPATADCTALTTTWASPVTVTHTYTLPAGASSYTFDGNAYITRYQAAGCLSNCGPTPFGSSNYNQAGPRIHIVSGPDRTTSSTTAAFTRDVTGTVGGSGCEIQQGATGYTAMNACVDGFSLSSPPLLAGAHVAAFRAMATASNFHTNIAWTSYPWTIASPVPSVSAQNATNLGVSSVTLHGLSNPNGVGGACAGGASCGGFEIATQISGPYVPTAGGQVGIGSGSGNVALTETVSGLAANTIYYYRVVSSSSRGTARSGPASTQTSQP
jgi:hypothetical protein